MDFMIFFECKIILHFCKAMESFLPLPQCLRDYDYGRQGIVEGSAAWQRTGVQEVDVGIYSSGFTHILQDLVRPFGQRIYHTGGIHHVVA